MLNVMAQIVLLPGFLGTSLLQVASYPFPPIQIWPPGGFRSLAAMIQLQLAADGFGPGPDTQGDSLSVGSVLKEYYGTLSSALAAKGQCVSIGYDWRMSLRLIGRNVASLIRAAYPVGPVVIVGHSMGGLVAKAALMELIAQGLTTYISKIIFLGTPQYGSWETFRMLYRLPALYKRLVETSGLNWIVGGAPNTSAVLDSIIPTWPATYELMPYKSSGPLFAANPDVAAAIYTRTQYLPDVPLVTQARLDAAWPVQALYSGAPGNVPYTTILGSAGRTAYDLNGIGFGALEKGYLYTKDGDGVVTDAEATLPGATISTFTADHNQLPVSRYPISAVVNAIPAS